MRKFEVVGRIYDERKFFVVVTVAVFVLNPFTANAAKAKFRANFQISFLKFRQTNSTMCKYRQRAFT